MGPHFVGQAWRLATWTLTVPGRHGIWRHPLRFAWQAWHLWRWAGPGIFCRAQLNHIISRICFYFSHTQSVAHISHTHSFATHSFVTHHLSHTRTHHTVTHSLVTHIIVAHSLVTHIFITHNLSHNTFSPESFTTQLVEYNLSTDTM